MPRYSQEFIRAIPKTDLHVHLDGSLRLATLIELARERKVALPSFTEQGLNELVFKDSYADLNEYLKGFNWTLQVLQDPPPQRLLRLHPGQGRDLFLQRWPNKGPDLFHQDDDEAYTSRRSACRIRNMMR